MLSLPNNIQLNGICPYFTMFPLDFPYQVLQRQAVQGDVVLDPFCGRGTTNYASRLLRLPTIGIDSSPVAVALSQAKLVDVTPKQIVDVARYILREYPVPNEIPEGEFWELAYDHDTLRKLCSLRMALLLHCTSNARKALRAIVLGGLHGPLGKYTQSYFSNQCQRTYAPKPAYAVRYWRKHQLVPPKVDVLDIIKRRAERYYSHKIAPVDAHILFSDSRKAETFTSLQQRQEPISWIITSPPYYGMRTYLPDQWLRWWFLGGSATVSYANTNQVEHGSPTEFAADLAQVWRNSGSIAKSGARMVVRFGGINDRKASAIEIFKQSLHQTGWRLQTRRSAGSADDGHRQALHFAESQRSAIREYDFWAVWEG